MALNPDIQRKAQQELDAVLGGSRLPEFDDRSQLPYVAALCKEVIRWHPVAPIAFPHATAKDDVIEGYFIPKGTLVFGNAWHMLHCEDDFGLNPDIFCPERFLQSGARDPSATGSFGFGRRQNMPG
ncbi:hypothetical protein M422DRAFT_270496 [Sphaerobolus stellatus SS14]|uniref:Cytochrome P450 n=1 Tax=Sphaerobolus stellatus (strain SS14) TaxID=990650 RepID=A0A0C9USC8_SPHS4|nr:hypothetical protein M422DRAFT_270496 [Sphaerobolus stellatus SS14]